MGSWKENDSVSMGIGVDGTLVMVEEGDVEKTVRIRNHRWFLDLLAENFFGSSSRYARCLLETFEKIRRGLLKVRVWVSQRRDEAGQALTDISMYLLMIVKIKSFSGYSKLLNLLASSIECPEFHVSSRE